jgi:hypothetical protein
MAPDDRRYESAEKVARPAGLPELRSRPCKSPAIAAGLSARQGTGILISRRGRTPQLDAHLTRDLTETFWGSIDAAYYSGGKSSINGVEGKKLDNFGFGLTFGYQINENVNLTFGYKSTVNDTAPTDLRMDSFMITLVFGWHPLLEGSRRLKGEK